MTTRDEIIQLAKDCHLWVLVPQGRENYIIDFAHLIAARAKAEEREACAKVCEEMQKEFEAWKDHKYDMKAHGAEECAEAIRARKETGS